jgi:hypothetical protein
VSFLSNLEGQQQNLGITLWPLIVRAVRKMNYLEAAKHLVGPTIPVKGTGRFCLRTPMGAYLFETRAEAVAQILDPKYCSIVDLAPAPPSARTIGDFYDADEARRERREAREKA